MKINHRHYILIVFAFASILVSVACYFFLYKQTTKQANNYLKAVDQVQSEKTGVNYEQKLIETFNKYEADRQKIESYMVEEDNLVEFIEQIEKIGNDSKTDLELSSIGNADGKIKVKVTAIGTWQEVMTALMMLENMPISISVKDVRLDTSGDIEKTVGGKTVNVQGWRLSQDIEVLTTK